MAVEGHALRGTEGRFYLPLQSLSHKEKEVAHVSSFNDSIFELLATAEVTCFHKSSF